MTSIRFSSTTSPTAASLARLQALLAADPHHPHIHHVDMPYRLASTWQDQECELAIWQQEEQLLAWALFLPPWWNLDFALHPSQRGMDLESELFAWGVEQMKRYARRSGEHFWGSVELFADTPLAAQTVAHLEQLGFRKFAWSTLRFQVDLSQAPPRPRLPQGFAIRPLRGEAEVAAYVDLHRAAFGSEKMTAAWRSRTLAHPVYRPETDLLLINPESEPVGFCIGWLHGELGQIEPLGLHPAYQGLGLGRALELAALQALHRLGARSVYVDHVSLNEKAIALSRRTGFRQANDAWRFYVDVGAEKEG